jgi:hypothetical protein
LPQLALEDQAAVRAALRPVLEELSSVAIRNAMQSIDISSIFDMSKLHGRRRKTVEVVLNGVTSTPFTRQLSPFNVWLMAVMLTFPNVKYRRGRLTNTKQQSDGRVKVYFEDGSTETFDRVVTRYGPGVQGAHMIAQPKSTMEPSGYLLVSPVVRVKRGAAGYYVDLAKHEIEQALVRLAKRRISKSLDHDIEKSLYMAAIEAPSRLLPKSLPRKPYSQSALVMMIKNGVRPKFSQLFRSDI